MSKMMSSAALVIDPESHPGVEQARDQNTNGSSSSSTTINPQPWLGMRLLSDWQDYCSTNAKENLPLVVFDGAPDRAILILLHNPDLMARCIAECYTHSYFVTTRGVRGVAHAADAGHGDDAYEPKVAELLGGIKSDRDHARFVEMAARYISDNLQERLEEFYGFFVAEVLDQTLRRMAAKKGVRGWKTPSDEDVKGIGHLMQKSLKRRLNARRPGGGKFKVSLKKLDHYYQKYRPMWAEAKKLYRSPEHTGKSPQKRVNLVREHFPELPGDQVEQFMYLGQSGTMPSELALETAARCCGVPADRKDGSYSITYLHKARKKIRKQERSRRIQAA